MNHLSRDLIRQTTALQSESQSVQRQETEVNEFIARYQLREEEVDTLKVRFTKEVLFCVWNAGCLTNK